MRSVNSSVFENLRHLLCIGFCLKVSERDCAKVRSAAYNTRLIIVINARELRIKAGNATSFSPTWNKTYGEARNLEDKHLGSLAPSASSSGWRGRGSLRRCDDGADVVGDDGGGGSSGGGGRKG